MWTSPGVSMRSNAGVVVLLVALAACATDSPAPVEPSAATNAAASETESSPVSGGSASTLPLKCAPPPARVEIDAGAEGNEWTLPVENGDSASVDVSVVVQPGSAIELLRIEVMPADGPGRAIGGPGFDPKEPPGPPVVWWTSLADDLPPGQYRFEITWAGTTTAGEPVPSGRYQLHGFAVVRQVDPPQDACDPEAGSESLVGAGLGYFAVVSSS